MEGDLTDDRVFDTLPLRLPEQAPSPHLSGGERKSLYDDATCNR